VIEVGASVATVEGLPSTMANELLEFESGDQGIAFNLDVRSIGLRHPRQRRRHRGGA